MVFTHSADGLVVLQNNPLELGIRIREVRDLTLPVAYRIATIEQVHEDAVHLFDSWDRALEDRLLEAFAESVIPLLIFFWPVCCQFKGSNLDHHLVVSIVGWQ